MPRRKNLKPSAETLRRLKKRVKILREEGIIDRAEIRKRISEAEARYWENKAKKWKPKTFKAGGSAEFRAQMARTANKIAVLLEKLENAKTSAKRRKIIKQLSEIRFAPREIEAKIPIDKKMNLETIKAAVFDKLAEIALNRRLPQPERIEALRTFMKLGGHSAVEDIIKMIGHSDRILKKEIIRLLSERPDIRTLETIKERLLKSSDINLKLIGLNIVSHCPSIFAIMELANAIKFPTFKLKHVPEKTLRRRKEDFVQTIADLAVCGKITKDMEYLFKRMQEELEKTSSKRFDLLTNIFVFGMTARAIRQWFARFGESPAITDEFRHGLVKELSLHIINLRRLERAIGDLREFDFAIRNAENAIEEIMKERG
ncbi:MAG: hypothetical protein J7L44_00965 [Candidatus Diapherotrites archaeon]|nr:hypothetical protein [Candidatus Diapherotrites archaeon]